MKHSRLRRWLLPLLAAVGAGVFVGWWAGDRPPEPLHRFQTDRYVAALLPDGPAVVLASARHWKTRFASCDLTKGTITEWPGWKFDEDHSVMGVTPRTFWTRPMFRSGVDTPDGKGPFHLGPFVAYDNVTGKKLNAVTLTKATPEYRQIHFGDRFVTAWRETWLVAHIRFRVFDPRSGRVEIDRLVPAPRDLLRVQGMQISNDGRHLALLLHCRRPKSPMDTLIVETTTGKPVRLLQNFANFSSCWSGDGTHVAGLAGYPHELRLQCWDWRSGSKVAERFVREVDRKLTPTAHYYHVFWLHTSAEWLVEENRRLQAWSPKATEFLRSWNLMAPEPPEGRSSLVAIDQASGQTRTVVPEIQPGDFARVMNGHQTVLACEPIVDMHRTYALYPLAGSYPWPWPWRMGFTTVAALVAFAALRWWLTRPPRAAGVSPPSLVAG